jgi:hypothetical protein
MNKENLYIISYVGTCENEESYCFDKRPITVHCSQKDLKKTFKSLRKEFLNSFLQIQKIGLKSYKNYKYGMNISIVNTNNNSLKLKKYYIDPINLKV